MTPRPYVYTFPVLLMGHGNHSSRAHLACEELLRDWNMQEEPIDGRIVSAILVERTEHFAPHPMPAKWEVFVVELHCRKMMGMKACERFGVTRLDPTSREKIGRYKENG